jgi:hypothetical protein
MRPQGTEGRFLEVPTPDAGGMDRRAFGEFVGPRGELASYALGWTSGESTRVGRLSVGIGVGNPGGGTFHANVLADDEGHAFALVDEPFESVPQGSPDLTADAARENEDLPFIWLVADTVMADDRRAWWMSHWLRGTSSIQTPQVFEREEPILLVAHDDDDALWQLIGSTGAADKGEIAHLHHAIDEDQTLLEVLDLEPYEEAERSAVGGAWTRRRSAPPK